MSLLTIVTQACYMLTIPPPATVIGNTEVTALQLLALANEEGRSLSRRHNWQALTTEKTFTTTAAAIQASSIPTDFDRMIPETMFNRTQKKRIMGPVSSDEWQQLQATATNTIIPVFRIKGNSILLYPTPTVTTDTIAYEYVTDNFCEASGGTDKAAWSVDTDLGLLDEDLYTLGIVWRFKQSHGMDFSSDFQIYEKRVGDAIIRDGSRPRLSSDPVSTHYTPRAPMIPEGSWDI